MVSKSRVWRPSFAGRPVDFILYPWTTHHRRGSRPINAESGPLIWSPAVDENRNWSKRFEVPLRRGRHVFITRLRVDFVVYAFMIKIKRATIIVSSETLVRGSSIVQDDEYIIRTRPAFRLVNFWISLSFVQSILRFGLSSIAVVCRYNI